MRAIIFAKRNIKEIMRDPMTLIFALGLPLFLLVIFQQFDIPSEVYDIQNFAPAIVIFSFSFISLFTAILVSKDRSSSFLTRMFVSPMKAWEYVIGYALSIIPLAIIQELLFYLVSAILGLTIIMNTICIMILLIFVSMLFVLLGILVGIIANDKLAPGLSSIIVQLVAFTSGMWFDTNMVSKPFQIICNALPYKYALNIARNGIEGYLPMLVVVIYTLVTFIVTITILKKKMKA